MGLGRVTSESIIHTYLHKPNNKLVNIELEHFWCMDKLGANIDSQNSPQAWISGKTSLSPSLIVYYVPGHETNTQMSFCPEIPNCKFPKLGLSRVWGPITLCVDLQLRWGLKQRCSLHQEISNDMWHTTYTQGSQGDFWLLVSGVKLSNWLLTFLLAITCVLVTQMGHSNTF